MSKTILIAEDEQVLREFLAEMFEDAGFEVLQAEDGQVARSILIERSVDLLLTDIRMPQVDGIALLRHLQQIAPQTPAIVLTAYGTVSNAVDAMQIGAFDYLLKPVNFNDVLVKVQRALEVSEMSRHQQVMTEQLASDATFHNLVGDSPEMTKLFDVVRKLAKVKSSVLLSGESGTGKELFARAIHYNGVTRSKPFVAVNCAAIPQNLIESELFGHRRGAFTGAIRDKDGYFEAANGGTLFLDEVSTLPFGVQGSLLRALEERAVVPVGDTKPRPVDLRVVAASNRDLRKMVANNQFRDDLLYRLNVVVLNLPPLRDRKEDIPALAHYFLERYTTRMNKHVAGLTNGAMRAMLTYHWPGNVRELANVIERAVIFAEDRQVTIDDLPFNSDVTDDSDEDLQSVVRRCERQHIMHCLRRHHFDKALTAEHLGISLSSLYRKIDELDIPKGQLQEDSAMSDC